MKKFLLIIMLMCIVFSGKVYAEFAENNDDYVRAVVVENGKSRVVRNKEYDEFMKEWSKPKEVKIEKKDYKEYKLNKDNYPSFTNISNPNNAGSWSVFT